MVVIAVNSNALWENPLYSLLISLQFPPSIIVWDTCQSYFIPSWSGGTMGVRWGDKSQECGAERSRASVSASGVAALVYLSSACDYKWSQFDGSSHAPHKDIPYSSHNAVIDVLEPVGRHGDDSTVPISSELSDMLTEFLSICRQHRYLTPPCTNHSYAGRMHPSLLSPPLPLL